MDSRIEVARIAAKNTDDKWYFGSVICDIDLGTLRFYPDKDIRGMSFESFDILANTELKLYSQLVALGIQVQNWK